MINWFTIYISKKETKKKTEGEEVEVPNKSPHTLTLAHTQTTIAHCF